MYHNPIPYSLFPIPQRKALYKPGNPRNMIEQNECRYIAIRADIGVNFGDRQTLKLLSSEIFHL